MKNGPLSDPFEVADKLIPNFFKKKRVGFSKAYCTLSAGRSGKPLQIQL
ncbi:hypothetical protein ACUXCC_004394 [Cytobacillus horneckiae]|nr:hypothetical protein [Cytobacillus horneckiae]MBN6889404.1 hypothetical protein [Cytobacillus horneckiae]MCM3179535.1 hypothetical protein [Cytobacillus horneckiae]MEC1154959.1 hypothetical protein [Cytobacillus horneckiae]MED2936135.1 hypothetical protein [Cytobacillus horneckiae]